LPDAFARRVARNPQLILLEESILWRVADPAAGAGGFETLTQTLCEQGWQAFQEIERQRSGDLGGIVASLVDRHLQKTLAEQRTARAKAVATRREPITGTSEFPNIREETATVLAIAPVKLDGKRVQGSLAERNQGEIIRSFVDGAGRADALAAPATGLRADPLPSLRLSEPFEALRDKADAQPQRPVVFLATLGPIADFTARAGFARNLFEAGGLAAPSGDGFAKDGATDLDALIGAFRASGAKLACLCGSDAAYAAEGPAVTEALAKAGATVWLAGRPAESEALSKAGVATFIYMGCDVVETLTRAQAIASA